jgi:V-type H+-transporting ATPase subunit H
MAAAYWKKHPNVQTFCSTSSSWPMTSSMVGAFYELESDPFAERSTLDAPPLAAAILEHPDPYQYFLSFLSQSNNPEDPIPLLSATFLVNLVAYSITSSSKPASRDDSALPKLYSYLSNLVKNQDSGLQDIGVLHLSTLLRTRRSKELFWKQKPDTVAPLFDILRKAAGAAKDSDSTLWNSATSIRSADTRFGGGIGLQLMYHVLLVVWQLSFEGKMVGEGLQK